MGSEMLISGEFCPAGGTEGVLPLLDPRQGWYPAGTGRGMVSRQCKFELSIFTILVTFCFRKNILT